MRERLTKKIREFRYTAEERCAIFESLEAYLCEEFLLYVQARPNRPAEKAVSTNVENRIIEDLESMAKFALLEMSLKQVPKDQISADIKKITKNAKNLLHLLEVGNTPLGGYEQHYHCMPGMSYRADNPLYLSITSDLRLIIEYQETILENIDAAFHQGRVNSNDPISEDYLDSLLDRWEYWTGKEPGKSKVGGPAARFVMHAFNPVKEFCKDKSSVTLRRKDTGILDEETAGGWISYHLSKMG